MKQRHVAHNYAQALYHAAEADKLTDRIESEVAQLSDLVEGTALGKMWLNPRISKPDKHQMVNDMLKGAHPYLLNFVHLLIERNRSAYVSSIYEEFLRIRDSESDTIRVRVYSAYALTKAVQEKIQKRLATLIDRQIRLVVEEDPNLIGGLRIQVQDNTVDGSVEARLEGLRHQLLGMQEASKTAPA